MKIRNITARSVLVMMFPFMWGSAHVFSQVGVGFQDYGAAANHVPLIVIQSVIGFQDYGAAANHVPLIVLQSEYDVAQPEFHSLSLAPIQKWVTPIDSYGPPHDAVPPQRPQVTLDGDTLPPEPVTFLRSTQNADVKLITWVETWETAVLQDQPQTPDELEDFRGLLNSCNLKTAEVYDLARGMVYVYHNKDDSYEQVDAACIEATRAVVHQCDNEVNGLGRGDPKSAATIDLLTRLTWIWGSRDYAIIERTYELISSKARASKEIRRADYLRAEAILDQGEIDKALQLYTRLAKENDLLRDASATDAAEVHWALGLTLYSANRYADAIPHFKIASQQEGTYYASHAQEYLMICSAISLAKSGDVAGSNAAFDKWVQNFRPAMDRAVSMYKLMNEKSVP